MRPHQESERLPSSAETPGRPWPRALEAGQGASQPSLAQRQVFRREGEYWTVAYDGTVCRLRDSKGMQLLAVLLGRPGERVRAAQLLGLVREIEPGEVAAAPATPGTRPGLPSPDGAAAERARVNVTRAIKGALQRIAAHHPTLCAHLRTTVRTGYACVYLPDPRLTLRWETFSSTTGFRISGWDEV